jgi:endoglucanase
MRLKYHTHIFTSIYDITGHDTPYPVPTPIPPLVTNYKGPNLSGGEFNGGLGKRYGWDYIFPTTTEIDYYASKGFGLIRVPFDMTRFYPKPYNVLDTIETGYMKKTVDYCLSKGMRVIFDPHNYGNIFDNRTGAYHLIGVDAEGTNLFEDFWGRLATLFKNYPNVVFNLMNEPNRQTALQWFAGAVPAIKAIRAAGATQLILIPGTSWTGAHSWVPSGNAAVWANFISDPLNNFAFDMHQYLDRDSSGTNVPCTTNSYTRLTSATAWLIANRFKGHLGEFGWTTDPSCTNEGVELMKYLSSNSNVWMGWAWWCAGPWYPSTYLFMLDPLTFAAPIGDREQMKVLLQHL